MKAAKDAVNRAESWIFRNGRPLEAALWNALFKKECGDSVVKILSLYQNEDGGFGNALEPDSWNPESSPYTTLYAIKILQSIKEARSGNPVYEGIYRYIKSQKDFNPQSGWSFTIKSNSNYPCAPWWIYSAKENKIQGIGLTAEFCSHILTNHTSDPELFETAYRLAVVLLAKLKSQTGFGEMGIAGYVTLLETCRKTGLLSEEKHEGLFRILSNLILESIEPDVGKWGGYVIRPSKYISSPDSPFYPLCKELMETELDYLIRTQTGEGVWPITWTWMENTAKYPTQFAVSERWWTAITAIEKIRLLANFGRLEVN